MKILKKIGAAVVALGMVITPLLQVGAASGINAYEQAVLNALTEPVSLQGREVVLPAQYVNQARSHFMSEGVDLTRAESDEMIGIIAQARAEVEASGYAAVSEMSQGFINRIVVLAERAAAVIGLTISIDVTGGSASVTILDNAGGTVVDTTGPVRQTGVNPVLSLVVGAALVGTLGTCAVVAKKRNLLA